MKKILITLFVISMLAVSFGFIMAAKPNGCTTIPSGELQDSMGNTLTPGYNQYGYNYQAHMSNQGIDEYCQQRNDIPEEQSGHWDYDDCMAYFEKVPFELIMWWNDAWLSNKDCDGDGLLDRHYGFDSYIGSGAWLTNHQRGTYELGDGKVCHWEYFVKIVAAPSDAHEENGYWYTTDGTEIGEVIWGSFATIQEVSTDQCDPNWKYSLHGPQPGFGVY